MPQHGTAAQATVPAGTTAAGAAHSESAATPGPAGHDTPSTTAANAPLLAQPAAPAGAPVADPSLTLPAPAAGGTSSESLYEKTKSKVKSVFGDDDEAASTEEAAPAIKTPAAAVTSTAPAAIPATPMTAPAAAVATPVPAADPSTALPAPAAGTTEKKSIYDRASDKVKEILKSDTAAAPGTTPAAEIPVEPADLEPMP
ncbi:MAG: hypothetical protein WBO06_09055 [Gammaproteobacteria bacterium]